MEFEKDTEETVMGAAHSDNAMLAEKAIALLGQRDFNALRAMMVDDLVAEGPYHPNGPATFKGADIAMRDFRQIKAFDTFGLNIVNMFDTGDETVIVEARSHGRHKDESRPVYANHYLFALSFREGKLVLWREFYNPLEAMKQGYGSSAT